MLDYKILPSVDTQKEEILNKLRDFNKNILGIKNNQETNLSLNFNIQDNEKVIAGINANLYFLKSVLHVDHLFVDEEYRSRGLGSKLLEKVEQIAKENGAAISHLDTFDWQAKDFYIKSGYKVFGVLEYCPKNHKRFYLSKNLD